MGYYHQVNNSIQCSLWWIWQRNASYRRLCCMSPPPSPLPHPREAESETEHIDLVNETNLANGKRRWTQLNWSFDRHWEIGTHPLHVLHTVLAMSGSSVKHLHLEFPSFQFPSYILVLVALFLQFPSDSESCMEGEREFRSSINENYA